MLCSKSSSGNCKNGRTRVARLWKWYVHHNVSIPQIFDHYESYMLLKLNHSCTSLRLADLGASSPRTTLFLIATHLLPTATLLRSPLWSSSSRHTGNSSRCGHLLQVGRREEQVPVTMQNRIEAKYCWIVRSRGRRRAQQIFMKPLHCWTRWCEVPWPAASSANPFVKLLHCWIGRCEVLRQLGAAKDYWQCLRGIARVAHGIIAARDKRQRWRGW